MNGFRNEDEKKPQFLHRNQLMKSSKMQNLRTEIVKSKCNDSI